MPNVKEIKVAQLRRIIESAIKRHEELLESNALLGGNAITYCRAQGGLATLRMVLNALNGDDSELRSIAGM